MPTGPPKSNTSARRNLINLEDDIAAQVRFDVRQLHLFAANYKIQQKVMESLYSQVENALEVIVAPVDPDSLKSFGHRRSGCRGRLNHPIPGRSGQPEWLPDEDVRHLAQFPRHPHRPLSQLRTLAPGPTRCMDR